MQRYIIFKGTYFYPSGGADDFYKTVNSIDEVKSVIKELYKRENDYDESWDWINILDIKEMTIIDFEAIQDLFPELFS